MESSVATGSTRSLSAAAVASVEDESGSARKVPRESGKPCISKECKVSAVLASIATAALASIAGGIALIATGVSIALGVTLIAIPIALTLLAVAFIAGAVCLKHSLIC